MVLHHAYTHELSSHVSSFFKKNYINEAIVYSFIVPL